MLLGRLGQPLKDLELAHGQPVAILRYLNEPTLVSKHVDPRCIVLRSSLDLTAVCLKR
jgi:hypothetical protein